MLKNVLLRFKKNSNDQNSTCADHWCWPPNHLNVLRHSLANFPAQDWSIISEITSQNQSELGSYRALPWTSIVIWPILSSLQSLSHICLCKSSSVKWVCADSHHSFGPVNTHTKPSKWPKTQSTDPSLELWGRRLLSSSAVSIPEMAVLTHYRSLN